MRFAAPLPIGPSDEFGVVEPGGTVLKRNRPVRGRHNGAFGKRTAVSNRWVRREPHRRPCSTRRIGLVSPGPGAAAAGRGSYLHYASFMPAAPHIDCGRTGMRKQTHRSMRDVVMRSDTKESAAERSRDQVMCL